MTITKIIRFIRVIMDDRLKGHKGYIEHQGKIIGFPEAMRIIRKLRVTNLVTRVCGYIRATRVIVVYGCWVLGLPDIGDIIFHTIRA